MKTIIIFLLFSAFSLECIAQLDMIVQKSILALSLDGSKVSSDSRIDIEKKLIQFDRTGEKVIIEGNITEFEYDLTPYLIDKNVQSDKLFNKLLKGFSRNGFKSTGIYDNEYPVLQNERKGNITYILELYDEAFLVVKEIISKQKISSKVFLVEADRVYANSVKLENTNGYINNPSFEDYPHPGTLESKGVKYWTDCGRLNFPDHTPCDLHGIGSNFFNCTVDPAHGKTYVGLVTRADDSYESISQKLQQGIIEDSTYTLEFKATSSPTYISASRSSSTALINYNKAVFIEIWISNGICNEEVKIFEAQLKKSTEWTNYQVLFTAPISAKYITFKANSAYSSTQGNALVDDIKNFQKITLKSE